MEWARPVRGSLQRCATAASQAPIALVFSSLLLLLMAMVSDNADMGICGGLKRFLEPSLPGGSAGQAEGSKAARRPSSQSMAPNGLACLTRRNRWCECAPVVCLLLLVAAACGFMRRQPARQRAGALSQRLIRALSFPAKLPPLSFPFQLLSSRKRELPRVGAPGVNVSSVATLRALTCFCQPG